MTAPERLEERVRETLAMRAEGVGATPVLWERVQRQAETLRRRRLLWTGALVAAMLAVVALAGTLVGPPGPEIDIAPEPEEEAPADAEATGPQTWTVDVDGVLEGVVLGGASVSILGYLPTDLTVRPGDTVEFVLQPGEVHTVTFGTLVDAALGAGPGNESEGRPPEFDALPEATTLDAEGVATGLAPCFSNAPPQDGSACEQQEQPVFSGDLALYNSGVLSEPGSTFTVEIADDIEPGDYGYLCLIHGLPMAGTISVATDAGGDVQTADDVEENRGRTLETLAVAMNAPVSDLDSGLLTSFFLANDIFTDGDDATVIAGGFGGPRTYLVEQLQFGPDDVEITAGQTVRWHFQTLSHTISFNPTPDATPYIVTGEDDLPTVNDIALTAQGGATPIPPSAELAPELLPGPPPEAVVIDGGDWDGRGFFSSGVSPEYPPVSYDITFTQPGTYDYRCLIHEGMTGTITVVN